MNDPFIFGEARCYRVTPSLQHGMKPDTSNEAVVVNKPAADKARKRQDGLSSSCSTSPLCSLSGYLSPRILNATSVFSHWCAFVPISSVSLGLNTVTMLKPHGMASLRWLLIPLQGVCSVKTCREIITWSQASLLRLGSTLSSVTHTHTPSLYNSDAIGTVLIDILNLIRFNAHLD